MYRRCVVHEPPTKMFVAENKPLECNKVCNTELLFVEIPNCCLLFVVFCKLFNKIIVVCCLNGSSYNSSPVRQPRTGKFDRFLSTASSGIDITSLGSVSTFRHGIAMKKPFCEPLNIAISHLTSSQFCWLANRC